MNPQQTTPTAMAIAVIAQPTGVDALLRKLPADVAAAVAANRSPIDQLRAISAALQSELDMRYKTVRRKMGRVLGSHGVASVAELIAAAFDEVPEANDRVPLPVLALPEACPEFVDGVQLLDALRNEFRRYVSLPTNTAEAAALWVVHTFAHDLADKSPILAVTSPVKRCGKSTLLELLQRLCAKAVGLSSLTPAILYRLIDSEKPTLLIDEADTFLLDNDDMRGILNSGFSRGSTAVVYRMVNGRPTQFSTWAPKVIACIGKLHDTLQDRAIEIRLQRKAVSEKLARVRDTDPQTFATLASKTRGWIDANAEKLRSARPEIPNELDDRAGDKWTPLLAIADVAGGHWPATARIVAVAISCGGEAHDDSIPMLLLADLRDIFASGQARQLPTTDILNRLAGLEDRPWSRIKNGRSMTSLELGRLLAPFGVKSRTLRLGKYTAKGYTAADLAPVFARYAANPVTSSQQA